MMVKLLWSVLVVSLLMLDQTEGWRRRRRRRCPVTDCAVSSFTSWSACTEPCGYGGTQYRTRTITRGASCGGSCPYALSETQACNRGCPNGGTPLSWRCMCKVGYSGRCCTDDNDECQMGGALCTCAGNGNCGAYCTNTFGSYTCSCGTGYRLLGNTKCVVNCAPGYYGVANGTCLQCPSGTYQPNEGSTGCLKCPYQRSSTELGAILESQCIDIQTCFPPWSGLRKRCYMAIDVPSQRWKDAFVACQALNGSHMLTISSEEENDFAAGLAKAYLKKNNMTEVQMWLGLRKVHAKAQFEWVDGRSLENSYTNWLKGEPNNVRGRELCTEMLVSGKYRLKKWNDVRCDTTEYKYITVCEKPLRSGE